MHRLHAINNYWGIPALFLLLGWLFADETFTAAGIITGYSIFLFTITDLVSWGYDVIVRGNRG